MLNVKYQYTHFIYPFTIENGKYESFLKSILSPKNLWEFKIHEEKEDEESYNFFLPYMKKFLFPTLTWDNEYVKEFKGANKSKQLNMIKKSTCLTFNLNLNILKKGTNYKKSFGQILFDILEIKLICFETGICFIDIKTEIEDTGSINFNQILDFNEAFRNIMNKEITTLKAKDIDNINDISVFIKSVISLYETKDISRKAYDKMFTYSYVCLDKECWNKKQDYLKIKNEFYKLQYVMNSSSSAIFNLENETLNSNSYSRWQFSEFGFSKESGVVLVSDAEKYNITKMPYNYEKKYLYMLLLAFYQRVSLINFSQDLIQNSKHTIKPLKKKLNKFTHSSWFSQITNSENGMDIWKKWQEAFELKELYDEVHREYLEYYDYIATNGQDKINILLIFLYTMSVIFAGFAILVPMLNLTAVWFKPVIITLIVLTALSYPIYALVRKIKHYIERKLEG